MKEHAFGINLPPYWTTQTQQEYYKARLKQNQAKYVCPLSLKLKEDSKWYHLPIDPIVSLSGANKIIKKDVLKISADNIFRGSVKELFSHSDYTINIAGVLVGEDDFTYPQEDICEILRFCESPNVIEVACDFLQYFGVTKMVIDSYDFPFTKGVNNQQFVLKCSSDMFDYNSLLIEV